MADLTMKSSHAPNCNDNDKRQRETRGRSTRLQTQHLFSDRHIASHLLRVTTISHPHAVSESGCAGLVLSFPKVQDVGNKKQTVFFLRCKIKLCITESPHPAQMQRRRLGKDDKVRGLRMLLNSKVENNFQKSLASKRF